MSSGVYLCIDKSKAVLARFCCLLVVWIWPSKAPICPHMPMLEQSMHGAQCTPTSSGPLLGFFLKLRETQCRQSLPHLDAKQVPWLRTRTCLLVEGGKLGRLPPWRCYTHLYICYTHLRKLAQHSTCPPSAHPCHIFIS